VASSRATFLLLKIERILRDFAVPSNEYCPQKIKLIPVKNTINRREIFFGKITAVKKPIDPGNYDCTAEASQQEEAIDGAFG
jgi:hypothetical protein